MTLIDLDLETRDLSFTPKTIDKKARTVELVASTGAGVLRRDMDGEFVEVLSVAAGAVDRSRVDGAPLLDNHRQDGLDRILGVVRALRIEKGELIVTVQFSERPSADHFFRDVAAGIIRNVSVGYSVLDFDDRIDRDGRRVRTVTKWALMEVSLVPVGADPQAKTRNLKMGVRKQKTAPAPAPAPVVDDDPPAPAEMTRAETNQEIRALAETFSLGAEWANDLIDQDATADEARALAVDAVRANGKKKPAPTARLGAVRSSAEEDPAAIVTRMGEALHLRANPKHKLSDEARPYVNMTLVDMGRHFLQLRGMQLTGLPGHEIITRALHTTSDFPLIFADTANRSLRQAYEASPAVLKALARQTTAKDFRAKTKLQVGGFPALEKVGEHGEFKRGTITEAGESYKIDTYGKIFGLTRQAIVNDDLGAFTDLAGKAGLAAAEFEAQFLVDLLVSNSGNGPTMADTKALFHADHGNKAGSGGAPDETRLSAARLAMRKQKGIDGRPINVAPRYVLAPADLETTFEKLLAALQPTKAEDVNPFGGKLELAVEARLSSATRWYIVGDPARMEGLEYAYLQGEEGPQIETRAGFDVDGVETKVRLDFGAAFVDHRGWYQNAGA